MMAIKYINWESLKYHTDASHAQIRTEQKMYKLGVNEGVFTVIFNKSKSTKYKRVQQEKCKTCWLRPSMEHAAK